MADPVGKLDIQVGFDLDEGSLVKIAKKMQNLSDKLLTHKSLNLGEELHTDFSKGLKGLSKEYKSFLKDIKTTYGVTNAQAKELAKQSLGKNGFAIRFLEKGEEKTKPSKNWTLQQLISKSDKYELLKKEYQEEGYKGSSLTKKLNKEFGRNYSQSYEKANQTKAYKLLKEETKLKQKGLPFLKEMGKLGGKGLSATVGKLGVVGGLAYLAYQGFKSNEGIYREKQTYTDYSKAMRETVDVYGGGQKGIDALSGFYGKFYGFQEKLQRGMADTSIFTKLAKATGDSELIDSLMRDDTKTFFTKVLNKAAQLKDAEAYNLFEAIGFSPDVGMDLVKDVRSGEFQKYLAKREKRERVGETAGEKSLKIGEKARKVINTIKDFGNLSLDVISLIPEAMSTLNKTVSKKDLITTAYRTAVGGSNNTYNYNWNNNITATGDMGDAVGGMSTLIDAQKRNIYNEQKVR